MDCPISSELHFATSRLVTPSLTHQAYCIYKTLLHEDCHVRCRYRSCLGSRHDPGKPIGGSSVPSQVWSFCSSLSLAHLPSYSRVPKKSQSLTQQLTRLSSIQMLLLCVRSSPPFPPRVSFVYSWPPRPKLYFPSSSPVPSSPAVLQTASREPSTENHVV